MKYVISVSKMYKHRGFHIHRDSTKKYWHIIGHEYDDYEEEWKMFCEQVSWIKAMYYKRHKFKRVLLHCPSCNDDNLHFIKKRTQKAILNEECPTCFMKYKDILEEIENEA